MLERLLIAAAIAGFGLFAYFFINRRVLAFADRKIHSFVSYRPGLPALVYFTTPTCAPCKTIQRPVIEKLQATYGRWFQVIEVDASQQPGVAQAWGVMTVPTTFVIDSSGKPRYVNQGIATAEKLIQQLEIEDYSI